MSIMHIARKSRLLLRRLSGFCITIIIGFFCTTSLYAQWREVKRLQLYSNITCVAPLPADHSIIFYGSYFDRAELWKSYNRGKTWKQVFEAGNIGGKKITSIIFKDSLTGWFACWGSDYNGQDFSGCYKTTDAGETWAQLPNVHGPAATVYYHPYNHRLFLTMNGTGSQYSDDEGLTWLPMGQSPYLTGIVFIDSLRGIALVSNNIGAKVYIPYVTEDGGTTWKGIAGFYDNGILQPVAFGPKIFFSASTFGTPNITNVYTIDPWGSYPAKISTLNVPTSAVLISDSVNIYTQSVYEGPVVPQFSGILKSVDKGKTWFSICGPNNLGDFTYPAFFVAADAEIWAGQAEGYYFKTGVWHNPTGKPNGPRLQLLTTTGMSDILTTTGSLIPIQLSYPKESYFEPVDSVTFIIKKQGEFLGFDRLSPMPDWEVFRVVCTDSDVTCTMRYVGSNQPVINTAIATAFFKAYIAPDTTGTITLDAVTFNQDVTFRDCMISSLTSTDSVTVHLDPTCGDSLIRQRQGIEPVIKINSINPNPTTTNTTIEFSTAVATTVTIEVISLTGEVVRTKQLSVPRGKTSVVQQLPPAAGNYFIKLSTGLYSDVARVVKQ